jgi:hypothetical protein
VLKAVRARGSGGSVGEAGQASAETTGLVVLVAVLFGALAVWVPGAISLPSDPPPFIDGLGALLGMSSPPLTAVSTTNPAIWQLPDDNNDNEPIGNFLRRTRDVVVRGGEVTGIFAAGVASGVKDGARARVVQIVDDPLGSIIEMIPRSPNPADQLLDGLARDYELAKYLWGLRDLSPEEAADRLGRDTGRHIGSAGVDALITRSLRAGGRQVARPRGAPTTTGERPSGPGSPP